MTSFTRDLVAKFEAAILWPIAIALIGTALLFALTAMWLWAIACVAGLFYLGLVRSNLRQGPVAAGRANTRKIERAAVVEARILAPGLEVLAVQRACTRVGGLIGVMIAEILFKGLGWDWYPAMVVGLIALLIVRAGLKLIFGSAGLPSSEA